MLGVQDLAVTFCPVPTRDLAENLGRRKCTTSADGCNFRRTTCCLQQLIGESFIRLRSLCGYILPPLRLYLLRCKLVLSARVLDRSVMSSAATCCCCFCFLPPRLELCLNSCFISLCTFVSFVLQRPKHSKSGLPIALTFSPPAVIPPHV